MNKNSMIQLSDAAAEHITEILKRHEKSVGFRLSVKATGCSGYRYVPEVVKAAAEKDIRVDTAQGVVVFLDNEWLQVLRGTCIDLVKESLGQKKLVFDNPNVSDECGCGESFSLKNDG